MKRQQQMKKKPMFQGNLGEILSIQLALSTSFTINIVCVCVCPSIK